MNNQRIYIEKIALGRADNSEQNKMLIISPKKHSKVKNKEGYLYRITWGMVRRITTITYSAS